ncbi:MAG: DUF402 domain-containing protein [Hungatella sp.]|nr:DUF402 domain-containing protein [Hungatella sp.]
MKRSRLSYDEWKCIVSKDMSGKKVNTDFFKGYIGLIDIKEVSKIQTWKFNGEDITVCDKGLKWLSILPQDDFYCITAMMNERNDILVWYIDMIEEQGIDMDGVPYFNDLYLDLVVYPNGVIMVDDMAELEEALSKKDITQEQFNLAINTRNELKTGLLSDVDTFIEYTQKCYRIIK